MTRSEHIAWCKQRALEYLPGNPMDAVRSMASDLRKHPEGVVLPPQLVMLAIQDAQAGDVAAVEKWINDF